MKRSVLSLLLFIGCLDLQAGRSSRRPGLGKASLIGSLLIGASRAQQCQFDQQRADKIVQEDFNNTLVRSAAPVSAILDQFDLCAWFKKRFNREGLL